MRGKCYNIWITSINLQVLVCVCQVKERRYMKYCEENKMHWDDFYRVMWKSSCCTIIRWSFKHIWLYFHSKVLQYARDTARSPKIRTWNPSKISIIPISFDPSSQHRSVRKGLAANKGGSLYHRFFSDRTKTSYPSNPSFQPPFSISLLKQIGSDQNISYI